MATPKECLQEARNWCDRAMIEIEDDNPEIAHLFMQSAVVAIQAAEAGGTGDEGVIRGNQLMEG